MNGIAHRVHYFIVGYPTAKDNLIVFDMKRSEVDEKVMRRQGKLDAGHLYGEATYDNVTAQELKSLQENLIGSEDYGNLAKRLIDFLYEPLKNFIDVLRTQFGQYWLPEVPRWDSRKESLGSYCARTLWMSWSANNGQSWHNFLPTDRRTTIVGESILGKGFDEYLTKEDWERLKVSFNPDVPPSLALILLGKAHELEATGHTKQAFVKGVTALEIALYETYRRKKEEEKVSSLFERFFRLPLPAQFVVTARATGNCSEPDFGNTLKAIDIRNDIVHKGKFPQTGFEDPLQALMRTVAIFLGLEKFKTPKMLTGNVLSPP
jgi:hypothetical protein